MKRLFEYQNGKIVFMTPNPSPAKYKQEFCDRTKQFRIRAGYNNRIEFAGLLGISAENYAKYETRTPLPHPYIAKYCILTNTHPWELFSDQPIPKMFASSGLNQELLRTIIEGVERSRSNIASSNFIDEASVIADLYSAAIEDESNTITPDQVLSVLRLAGRIKTTKKPSDK